MVALNHINCCIRKFLLSYPQHSHLELTNTSRSLFKLDSPVYLTTLTKRDTTDESEIFLACYNMKAFKLLRCKI